MTSISLVPTFEQVPYNSLISRIDNGSQGLFELTNLFNERKELEEKNVLHSAKVSRSNIYEYEINSSSCECVLGFFKNYHLFLSKVQVKHHKGLGEIIIKDLDDLKISRAALVNRHKIAVQNCLREVAHAEEALDKAKKNYQKAKSDLERGKNKLVVCEAAVVEAQRVSEEKKLREAGGRDSNKFSMGRMLSAFENTPEQERDKQQKKVDRRNNEVALCQSQIVEKKAMLMDRISVMDSALQKACVAFQEAEFERISKLKVCMKNFCELERAAINARSELLTVLEDAINSQNVEDDLSLFISQEKNVELTHKYTNAIGLMDLHFKKHETEMQKQYERNRMQESENGLGRSFDAAEASTAAAGSPITTERRGSAAVPMDHRDAESGSERRPPPTLEYDDNGPDSSTSIASQGDLNKIERMSLGLSALFPLTPSTAASPNSPNNGNNSPSPTTALGGGNAVWGEADWRELIFFKETRELFLQELDEQRGRRSLLTREGFASMCNAMKVLLDYCETFDDAKSAMRVVNMANTFHTINESIEAPASPSPTAAAPDVAAPESEPEATESATESTETPTPVAAAPVSPTPTRSVPKKHYLQAEPKLNRHSLWRKQGFWELALQEGTLAQMCLNDPSQWDELNPEGLREAVIGVHNIVFGQLGSLAFAMHELGLSAEEVEKNIFLMSRRAQLTEDQELELIKNVRIMYGIYVPPPLPPIVAPQQQTQSQQPQQQQAQISASQQTGSSSETSVPPSPPIVVVGKVIATADSGSVAAGRPVVLAQGVVTGSATSSSVGSGGGGSGSSISSLSAMGSPPPLPGTSEDTSAAARRSSLPPKGESVSDSQLPPPLPSQSATAKPAGGGVPPLILKGTAVPAAPPSEPAAAASSAENSFFSLFGRSNTSSATSTLKAGVVKGNKSAPASAQKPGKTSSSAGRKPDSDDPDDFFATL